MLDELLKKTGLKYEDLKIQEKETLNVWMDALTSNNLTLEKVREYILAMKHAVEMELSTSKVGSKQDMLLKARLRNYLLLEAFLSSPERAREQIERAMAGMVNKLTQ